LNLPQAIVIAQYDSDKAPQNRCRGGAKRAEFLTFRRGGSPATVNTRRDAATQPLERPPDPENGSPGAVGTATEAEVQSALARTIKIYPEPCPVSCRGCARGIDGR
jgi:hypothetical protein